MNQGRHGRDEELRLEERERSPREIMMLRVEERFERRLESREESNDDGDGHEIPPRKQEL